MVCGPPASVRIGRLGMKCCVNDCSTACSKLERRQLAQRSTLKCGRCHHAAESRHRPGRSLHAQPQKASAWESQDEQVHLLDTAAVDTAVNKIDSSNSKNLS